MAVRRVNVENQLTKSVVDDHIDKAEMKTKLVVGERQRHILSVKKIMEET